MWLSEACPAGSTKCGSKWNQGPRDGQDVRTMLGRLGARLGVIAGSPRPTSNQSSTTHAGARTDRQRIETGR